MVTVKADQKQRVRLPDAKPGQVFAYESVREGKFILTVVKKAEPESPTCSSAKENGFTVAVPDQPIDEKAIKELLADFP